MKSNIEFEEFDWITEDPFNKDNYLVKQSSLFKYNDKGSEKLFVDLRKSSNDLNNKEIMEDTNIQYVKFSSLLSGKNIIINGGGTIATLGRGNNEDYVVVDGINPRGIVYLEFICPLSCQGLLFGMCNLDLNNPNSSVTNILTKDKKSFKSFRTTSRRKVGMEIDYDKRKVRFFLEGMAKDKTLEFQKNSIFPCIIISSKSSSIVLNTFSKHNDINFPLYLLTSNRSEEFISNLLSHYVFIFNLPKITKTEDFNLDNFINEHFKISSDVNPGNKHPIRKIYAPVSDGKIDFFAILFENSKILEDFIKNNKDVKINDKVVKIHEKNYFRESINRLMYKNYDLVKLSNKDFPIKNIDLKITRLSNLNEINRYMGDESVSVICNWFSNEYENIVICEDIILSKLFREIETTIQFCNQTNLNLSNYQNDSSEVKSYEDANIKIEYLPLFDRLVVINNTSIKLLARDKHGKFEFIFTHQNVQNNSIDLVVEKKELLKMINNMPWKTLINDNIDYNKIKAIDNFFKNLKQMKTLNVKSEGADISDQNSVYLLLNLNKKTAKKFVEAVISFLNKSIFIAKEKEIITNSMNNTNKNLDNKFDLQIDSQLPFALEYDNHDEEVVKKEETNKSSFLNEYILQDTETTFSIYNFVLKMYEQIAMVTNDFNEKKSNLNQSTRWFSSMSRLSTFINYPLTVNNSLLPIQMADKGLYVDNTLTNQLKLYGYTFITLIDANMIKDSESLDKELNKQFPFNYINKTNFWPNIELNFSINSMPALPHFDSSNNQNFPISNLSRCIRIPFIVSSSDNGTTSIWNYTLGLNLLLNLNVKKGIKSYKDMKEIKEISWLKNDIEYKTLPEILLEDNFEFVKLELKIENQVTTGNIINKEKEVPLNQEMINNLYVMGFPLEACKFALKETKNNFDKGLEFLLEKTGDVEFMKKFSPKEIEKDTKIQPWHCNECTFLNEKGDFNCEICGAGIPDKILKEFIDQKSKKKEENRLDVRDKMIEEIIPIIQEESVLEFKDCRIINSHLLFDNSDPAAPFLIVTVLFDYVLNKMIISCHKLMINPIIFRDLILVEKEVFICKIDNKKFCKIEEAISHLNSKYFFNLHTLYPKYLGPINTPKDNNQLYFKHLIPVEHTYLDVPVVSIFDSFAFDYQSDKGSEIAVIVELSQGNISLMNFNIKNKYKFSLFSNKSLEIDYITRNNLEEIITYKYPSELKVIRDIENIYIITQENVLMFDSVLKFNKMINFSENVKIGLFKKVDPIFENFDIIKQIKIYDDLNGMVILDITNNLKPFVEESNKDKISCNNSSEINSKSSGSLDIINQIKVEDLSYTELNILSQLLDFETINLRIYGDDDSKSGVTPAKAVNEFKKIYVDLRNRSKAVSKIDFAEASISVLTNIEFILKTKNKKNLNLSLTNTVEKKLSANISDMNIPMNNINDLKNIIPLTILEYKGSQSQVNVNVSSIIFGDSRFTTNYSKPYFLFSNLHGKIMNIESFVIGSDLNSKVGEAPLGEGLIFLLNDLESINLAKEFSNLDFQNFQDFITKKLSNNEEIFEWEPMCYVKMADQEFIRSKVYKPRPCKYVYFLPTSARKSPKDFSQSSKDKSVSLIIFAAEGCISSCKEDFNEYLNKSTENVLINNNLTNKTSFKLKLKGMNTNNEFLEIHESNLSINGIMPNTYSNIANTDLLISKISITNDSISEHSLKNLIVEITSDDGSLDLTSIDLNYEILGYSIESLSFKSLNHKKLKECKNLVDINVYELRKVIVEKNNFDIFNKKFISLLTQNTLEECKRLYIIKYLKFLISTIPSISTAFEETIDFFEFSKVNILQSHTVELINNSIEFLKNFPSKLYTNAFILILDNLSNLKFSEIGFRSFISFLPSLNIDSELLITKILKIISYSLKYVKESEFQTTANIFLKSHLKIEETPFDTNIFVSKTKKENEEEILQGAYAIPINCSVLCEVYADTLKLNIDMNKIYTVSSIRLLFSTADILDSHFRIIVWGSNLDKNKNENFDILNYRSYLDHTWKQLTKYEGITNSKENLFQSPDIRSLEIDNLNFTGRYLMVEILLNQGERQAPEFPKNFYIAPQVIGELCLDLENYEYPKINSHIHNFIPLKTQNVVFMKKFKYLIKLGTDANKYMILAENDEKEISINEIINNSSSNHYPATELSRLKQNLKSYQVNLDKILTEILIRKETADIALQLKIKTLIEDIVCIQNKISAKTILINMNDSLSININVLLIFIKFLMNIASKNGIIFNQAFLSLSISSPSDPTEVIGPYEFILYLFEVCVFNHYGELLNESLSLLKNYVWVALKETNQDNLINRLFDNLCEAYLSKDVFYRSALKIVEALSYIDFGVEIILTKLKDAFSKHWTEEEIADAFFNISSLIILLILKLKNKDKQIASKCVDIISVNLEFIRYLTKESKFTKEINDIILEHSLNLLRECFKTTDFETLNKIINPELIEYMVKTMFDLWGNDDIKNKFFVIIDKLIDPFDIIYNLKNKNLVNTILSEDDLLKTKKLSDKITLNTQTLTINYIQEMLTNDSNPLNLSDISDDKTNKLDYIFNLLIKTYSINSHLKSKIKEETNDSLLVKKANSEIIEKFIKIILKFNQANKIGYSIPNNFWKYLTDILERSSLSMLFYNNIFSNLLLNSFINFHPNLQELLYTKFVKVFHCLYSKDENHSIEIYDQAITVILHILNKTIGTENETVTLPFITQISEILLCGETPYLDTKESTYATVPISFKVSTNIKRRLFNDVSTFICQYLNIASFTGSICSNKTVFIRISLAKVLMQLINTFIKSYLAEEKQIDDDFRNSIRNYLIFMIFDYYSDVSTQSPTIIKTAKTWNYVNNVIDSCSKSKILIEVMLTELMKILRKVDDQVFLGVRSNKMSLKKGIVTSEKLFSTLEQILNKCLYDDEITKFFAFELQGFKFFIDRVNTHRQHVLYLSPSTSSNPSNTTYKLNADLLKSLTLEASLKDSSEKEVDDENIYTGNFVDYNYEEFAVTNKFSLLEGDPNNPTIFNNVNWNTKKRGANSHVYTRDMKDGTFHEESFLFRSSHLIEVKDVFIGFNFIITNIADKLAGIVPAVYLEAGTSLNKMDICVKLDRIDDNTFYEKGVIVYGFNFYSYMPELIKLDELYLENIINQLLNCRAKYFRFIVRRPLLLSNDNSHNTKINANNIIIGINHVSIYGSKIANTQKVLEFMQEKEKNISIKIISKIFTAEFIDTLKYIANDSSTIDNIKQIYDAFEPYINQHATILSNILINVSKYNFELGEWLLSRLLNVDNSEIHAKLAVEITQNNEEYVNERINKYLSFILKELNPCSPLFFSHDVDNKLKNLGKFAQCFTISLNGLLVSPFQNKVINLKIDFEAFLSVLKNLQKYSIISSEIIKLITILLNPNKKLLLNQFLDPEETVFLLNELFTNTYIFDYLDILSYLIANNEMFEKICRKKKFLSLYCEQFLSQVNSGIRGKNMLCLMNVLKNMSFSKAFVNVVRENDFDFMILFAVKNDNEKSDSIMINNNNVFIANLVIFMRNCIIDYPECQRRLAEILINDLEVCKKKIDKAYANNVLMPLLRMEKVIHVCIHPIDSFLKTIYSTYCNLAQSYIKEEKPSLTENTQISTNVSNENYLPGSQLPPKVISQFKEMFTNFEWTPKKNFAKEKFTKVFSSKTADKNNIIANLSAAISNIGPFLLVLYPAKPSSNPEIDLYTFFYCVGTIPVLPSTLSINDSNTMNIPYTYQNFIGQIQGDNYVGAHLRPEYDDTTGKEYEIGFLSYDSIGANINISADIIILYLTGFTNSTVNPYTEATTIIKSKGINELKATSIKDYEIYVSNSSDKANSFEFSNITGNSKIISTKYMDETGNLDFERIKSMKYYKSNHPFHVIRNNPILEIPMNITMKVFKEFLINSNVQMNFLFNQEYLKNDLNFLELNDFSQLINDDRSSIVDICYDVPKLRGILGNAEQPLNSIPNYQPKLPVFEAFEKLDGIRKIVSVLKTSICMWKSKDAIATWTKWIDDVEKFAELPSFFSNLIRHSKCFDIIFNLLCGLYDNETAHKEVGLEANKYIYEILNDSFIATQSYELRKVAIDKGIFNNILDRLQVLSREKPRKYLQEHEEENIDKVNQTSGANTATNNNNIVSSNNSSNKDKDNKAKKVNKKGVGFGSDHTGDNKQWDLRDYLEDKKVISQQIASIINLLTNFLNSNELKITESLNRFILESPLLPVLESAFRGGTLLELAKEDVLYYAYLNMTLKLSENSSMIPYLLDISKDYKPMQNCSILNLLSQLNDVAKIFVSCIKKGSEEKTTEEKLAIEINKTFDIVSKNIKEYKLHIEIDKHYGEILKLPVDKSYPLIMRELCFDYMNMRDNSSKIIHYYASSITGDSSKTKMIRLAQEYADLSRSLPCESTNAIFIRVDQDNMDLMKALIMGSAGTPYGHGAFEFDIYFDAQYPNGPPKVNLMTTGGGNVRFNPNLYANGKVCLSLLGTWRGQSTENWDAKISTLLQVLISIQSIIMSDLVYFNEPSCETEMGKPEGEAKNEGYSNIVRYCNIKFAMIEQIKKPSKGFEEVIRRHFYLKKDMILQEVRGWIERSKTAEAKYSSFSYDHNPTWAQKMNSSKNYTKMLEDIYVELDNDLNNLPLPSELQKKTEESEKIALEKAKKKEKMEFISLETVDVTYDNDQVQSKEFNINDEAVKDRWSRTIGAMGLDAVQRQANSSVFLSGANGLGIEIAKNIVLSGCKKFVLHDTKKTNFYDLSSQFFLSEQDIGLNRAEACIKKLQQLNYYVKIFASTAFLPKEESDLDKFGLKDFTIVILSQCDYETQILVNKYCRKRGIYFISTDLYGAFGRVINDFGDKFTVNDKDGEDLKECMIKSISSDKEGIVTVLDGTRHNFQDGDEVIISEVESMDNLTESVNIEKKSINGTIHKLTVINPQSFKIGDTSVYTEYFRNGMAKQIKSKKEMEFKELDYILNNKNLLLDENLTIADFTKMDHSLPLHIAFNALDIFNKSHKGLPQPWNLKDSDEILQISKKVSENYDRELSENDIKLIRYLSFTAQGQLCPLAAFFGGIAAQEAIKAMTAKFTPINQIFYYDALEVLPDIDSSNYEESLKSLNYTQMKNRTDGLNVVIGEKTLKTISDMKILVVGSGAIGCELLKNFAMLEVGTGISNLEESKGSIFVTDPDIIEVSNLNRQFLFREKHLRQPKSATAAAAIIQMNKSLKNHIFAKLDKVCEETEYIFNDKFFSELTLVANALDNIQARRYVDSRCVSNRIPLLESGTLGAKGHVQVVIPNKTESYSSQQDPEVNNDIPQCTLKMFPEEALHCLEWARDQFGKYFTQKPKTINKFIEEGGSNQELKILKQVVNHLKRTPVEFKDCIFLAREKFQKLFHNNIKQLLFAYPLDKQSKDGKLFWSLPKRPPISADFDPKNSLHNSFIAAYACLMANQFKIPIPYQNPRNEESKFKMGATAAELKLPEFVPNQLKAKEIENQVEKEKKEVKEEESKGMEVEIEAEDNSHDANHLLNEYSVLCIKLGLENLSNLPDKEKREKELFSQEFEKDNDSNFHIDLIHSMTNLRCMNYKLEEMDWIKVKIKAGRIIPALATTTAAIAGLQSLELVKIAKNSEIEHMRNSFINLAIPYIQASEPGSVSKIKIKEDLEVTLWDRWEVNLGQKQTLGSVYQYLNTKFGLYPRDCFKGKKAIFAHTAYESEDKKAAREEIMNKNLLNLLGLSADEEYVDVIITFTIDEKSEEYIKNTPIVRILFC